MKDKKTINHVNSERLDYLLNQLKSEGKDPFLQYAVSMEYMNHDREKALQVLEETREDFPEYLPLYYQLATLLEERDEIDKCKEVLKEGIKLANNQSDAKALGELQSFLTNVEFEY